MHFKSQILDEDLDKGLMLQLRAVIDAWSII